MKLVKRTVSNQRSLRVRSAIWMIIALLLAFVVAGLLIVAKGVNPIEAYMALFSGAFGSKYRIGETLLRMTPLLLISVGVAIGYRSGMFNMGGEGQFIMGMLGATVIFLYVKAGALTIPLALLASILAGGLYCAFPAAMKAKFGISETIINIMLNYIAALWLSRLLNSVLKDPAGYLPQSPMIDEELFFPIILSDTRLHSGFIIAIVLAVIFYVILFHTPLGYKLRAIGSNVHAARYAGYKVMFLQILAMFIAGGMAGLAGGIEIGGLQHRLMEGISANYGWDAIPIALLGGLNPLGIIISSMLFGAIKVGSNTMQTQLGVPNNLSSVLQGLVILFVLGSKLFVNYKVEFTKKKDKKEVQTNA